MQLRRVIWRRLQSTAQEELILTTDISRLVVIIIINDFVAVDIRKAVIHVVLNVSLYLLY